MSNSIALPDDFHLPEMEVLYTTTNRDGDPHRIMGYTTDQVKAVAVRAFILGASSAKPIDGVGVRPVNISSILSDRFCDC